MKRTPLKRGKPIERRTPVRKSNPARRKREHARAYGPKARIAFVRSLPCIVPGASHIGPIENAHIETGGMGRKADASLLVPLCHSHHRLLHSWGVASFQRVFCLDLAAEAEATEAAWQSHLNGESK